MVVAIQKAASNRSALLRNIITKAIIGRRQQVIRKKEMKKSSSTRRPHASSWVCSWDTRSMLTLAPLAPIYTWDSWQARHIVYRYEEKSYFPPFLCPSHVRLSTSSFRLVVTNGYFVLLFLLVTKFYISGWLSEGRGGGGKNVRKKHNLHFYFLLFNRLGIEINNNERNVSYTLKNSSTNFY